MGGIFRRIKMKTNFSHDPDESWQRIDSIDDITGKEFIIAAIGAVSAIAVATAAIYSVIGWLV